MLGVLALLLTHLFKPEAIKGSSIGITVLYTYIHERRCGQYWRIFTGSVCIHEAGRDMKLPAGIVVPSENVKSFIVVRGVKTANFTVGTMENGVILNTHTLRLAQTAWFL